MLYCSYNPSRSNIDFHLEHLNRNLALYSSCYANFMIIGDPNVEANNSAMSIFCDTYNLKNLIKEPTCYKSPNKPSCFYLTLTNKPRNFKHSCVIETGLSDFHRMTVTVMKATFEKLQPRVVNYRDYKYFENYRFRADLLSELSQANIEENEEGLSDLHAPRKQKYARGNHMPFMNRALSKEIMTRTRLRNNFLKNRSEENKRKYSKQRNYCVSLLRKSKSEYFGNLNEKKKKISDNKKFWKTVKLFLSDKITSTQKITLIEKEEIIKGDGNTAEVLNSFFSNIVSNLKTEGYSNCDPLANNIRDPVLKCIVKYRTHPSILAIGEVYNKNRRLTFSFSKIKREAILSDILKLETPKACQETNIPTKIVKENADIFDNVLVSNFNDSIENSVFHPY